MRSAFVSSFAFLAISLTFVASARQVRGDEVRATRFEVVERSHVVALRIDRGFATLVVQRTVENEGPISDQAVFHLDLPEGAVATRLRTSSAANGTTTWFEGELMEAEAAAHKYEELTGVGGYYPKDPALLSWRTQRELALQVFPVPPQAKKTVEYTLKIPLVYEAGAYHVTLPALGSQTLAATVHAAAAHAEDRITINGVESAGGAAITANAANPLAISLTPHAPPLLDTVLSSTEIKQGQHLVHARINAAAQLAEVPHGARVVVLFDASRSQHNADAAIAAVRGYLGNMPDAVVDFLAFDRTVSAPFGRALPVATALAKLASYQPKLGNGSALDAALVEADRVLASSQAAAKRVVVVTDARMRSALTPEKLGAMAWQSSAILHVATIADNDANLHVERDDATPWAKLPRRTGGLFWNVALTPKLGALETQLAFEELARPKRIDRVQVTGLSGDPVIGATIDEGTGIDHFVVTDAPTSHFEIHGELWSKPLSLTVFPNAEQAKLDAALVFGSELLSGIEEPAQMKLALLGRAVSPVTSYLAIEPGVRPSTEGLDWNEGGIGDGVGVGYGASGPPIRQGYAMVSPSVDEGWLRNALKGALRGCSPGASGADVTIETTLDEIVDVTHVAITPHDAKAESCLREATWNFVAPDSLDEAFREHALTITL